MKKCETFEDLQALGTEKIHEATHISRDKLDLVLSKSFGEIGKVQFMGFLSILEREYGVDLNPLREEYMGFYEEHQKTIPPKTSVILQAPSNTKTKWVIAGAATIALLMGLGYFYEDVASNAPAADVMQLSSAGMEVAEPLSEANLSDSQEANATLSLAESNASKTTAPVATENNATQTPVITAQSGELIFRPAFKVWAGLINLSSGEKMQKITADPIALDGSKNWLIVLGHGRVEIDQGSDKKVLTSNDTVRFAFENGVLKELSKDEFMARNGGKTW